LQPFFPDTDAATLRLSFEALIPAIKPGGRLSERAVRNQAQVLVAIGALDAMPATREGVLWTNRYHR
ncbi:MAG: hypothetical protein QN139_11310, partial [Armatimonadota bacterium]|nr:hypothetical protein [Armatimonadota bacterium]